MNASSMKFVFRIVVCTPHGDHEVPLFVSVSVHACVCVKEQLGHCSLAGFVFSFFGIQWGGGKSTMRVIN